MKTRSKSASETNKQTSTVICNLKPTVAKNAKPIIVKLKYTKHRPRSSIKKLSLQEIKDIQSSPKIKKTNLRQNELVHILDKNYRQQIYDQACNDISYNEIQSWPTYGGRPWQCIVTINEDKLQRNKGINNSDILFRLNDDGEFELACLNDLLNDIPIDFPSNQKKRTIASNSKVECSVKIVIDKVWISPQLEHFRDRSNALNCANELIQQENLINKFIYGVGSRGKLLRPFQPTMAQALEAGLYRFQQDGLWIVGQEESWQEGRAYELGIRTSYRSKNQENYKRWCLPEFQQEICHSTCLKHYDSVMYTVKARCLHAELDHGFDVLRERGRGRYDMEISEFDTMQELSILTDENAPWMPIVRTILGEGAMLIHKGCFLSLPGSETQVYHQDGIHLSNTQQRPCHAVNVFIPLVDLTSKNGPTEFCTGTHILGNDHFQKNNIVIPLVEAGTPVIFDYRLGHRGLGNTTLKDVRPILYLSYASSNFRDSVNFSRKRYIKLGAIITMPISREERALKRAEAEKLRETTSGSDDNDSSSSTLIALMEKKEIKVSVKNMIQYES